MKSSILYSSFLLLVACGGGGSSSPSTGTISLALSDSPVDEATSVTITVDRITLNRDGEDVVVDTFTIEDENMNLVDSDTFTMDLLDYQGEDSLLVFENLVVPAGTYQNLRLHVIDGDVNSSFVIDAEGTKPIKQPSNELKLGGFTVEADGVQSFVVEFDLRKSLTYNPTPERYILKPRGVRIVEVAQAATIGGAIDTTLFNGSAPCDAKVDPLAGNVMYLYPGHDLNPSLLSDVYDPNVLQLNPVPVDAIEPYSATTVADDGSFMFSYVEPGDYTIAFSCAAQADDPEQYNNIAIPTPDTEII